MANYWDTAKGLWIDDATGNTFDPREGFWRNQDQTQAFDAASNTWNASGGATAQGLSSANVGGALSAGGGVATPGSAFTAIPGWDREKLETENAQETSIQQMVNDAQANLTKMQADSQQTIAKLNGDVQKEIAKGNNASSEKIAQLQAEIDQERNRITLELGKEQNKISLMTAQVSVLAEQRAERELQAKLAANPNDFVAYEFYKRGLQQPGALPGVTGGTGSPAANTSGYPAAPPAYDNTTLQQVVSGLQNPTGPAYNPRLSGEGVFGAQIEAPNQLTRAEAGNMSENQAGMLASVLRGGINMGGAGRVSIDPAEYLAQASRSWVPTLQGGATGGTKYR